MATVMLASELCFPAAAAAFSFEKLVMPGPVVAGHAPYEEQCQRCHEPFKKAAQRQLCLACHDQVAEDLERAKGFHGRTPQIARVECRSCHGDHAGRDADIVGLDREAFDHTLTDFPLQGAHRGMACGACHPAGKKPRETASACQGCHASEDVHRGALGSACGTCHQEDDWRSAHFDHDRTGFALAGAHRKTECAACHPDQRYEGAVHACGACHRAEDVHRGRRGQNCQQCHDSSTWTRSRFDHRAASGFALRGSHAELACDRCHKGDVFDDRPPADCQGCHRPDDPHQGEQGERCERCHGEDAWTSNVRFDHDLSRFPLVGMHAATACEQCHPTATYRDATVECRGCHAAEDQHRGRLGVDCGHCHNPNGWMLWSFDHATEASFALDGAHEGLACEACHLRSLDEHADLPANCGACHSRDDVHDGAFGPRCDRCHSTASFALERRP